MMISKGFDNLTALIGVCSMLKTFLKDKSDVEEISHKLGK